MHLKVYVNNQLIETLEIEGPGYDPVTVINEIKKHHSIELGDQIKIIPSLD
jgi:hypothetical protein